MIESLRQKIENYPTKYKEGFVAEDLKNLSAELGIDYEKLCGKIGVVTCMVIEGQTVIYHSDVLTAVRCVIEDRDMHWWEWD